MVDIVLTQNGKIRGKLCTTDSKFKYYSYKGIPYAKPPIDDLRFLAPVAAEPWEGIRDATQECNICAQFDRATNTMVGDEDCLYLNVYVPSSQTEPLPVMVFFHGGGFVFGNGTNAADHGPDFLIEKDVIVVSLNYRLGVLGFLSLDRKEAAGNMGLKDQVKALKWVQKNISNFNGDPNNVTLFGVSAGGASIEYLLLSKSAKGLFHKAILQSGSSLLHWAYTENLKNLASLIPTVQGKTIKENDLYDYLMNLPTKDLVIGSMMALEKDTKNNIKFGFVPTVEKPTDWEPFLDQTPYSLLKTGQFSKVPIITGFTKEEGLLMDAMKQEEMKKFLKDKSFIDFFPFEVDETSKPELEKSLSSIYKEKGNDDFAIDFFTDVDFLSGVYVSAGLLAQHSSPVYMYEFSYDGGMNYLKNKLQIKRKGACHGDDGGYLIKSGPIDHASKNDLIVKDQMVTMWTNFAKFGNPTPNKNELITATWEPLTHPDLRWLEINDVLRMKANTYVDRMNFYKTFYENRNK